MRAVALLLMLVTCAVNSATITPERTGVLETDTAYAGASLAYTWETLTTTNDTGVAVQYAAYGDRSVQMTGTWGSGGSVDLEGSNDGVTYFTLHDQFGVTISLSANGLVAVAEAVLYMRPRVTAGDGTTDIDVTVFLRGK